MRFSSLRDGLSSPVWTASRHKAKEGIANATTVQSATAEIAAVLTSLNDSHTFFVPPKYSVWVDYGWQSQMIGDRRYVTHVLKGSDDEAKGLKPGDEIMMIDGIMPTRENSWKIQCKLNIYPQYSLRVDLFDPSTKKIRKVDVAAKVWKRQNVSLGIWDKHADMNAVLDAQERRHLSQVRSQQVGPELMILKIPSFAQSESEVEYLLDIARKHQTLIMDLRGNQGGSEDVLKYWVGCIFSNDAKIADRVWRGKMEAVVAKSNPRHIFSGKLIVIVDSNSASAAELFARVVQIEKRGIVLGDRTSGMTMEGRYFPHAANVGFGVNVTQAELVMKDGKSLEHLGVTPDETVVPAASDLANNRDPVIARAAELAGASCLQNPRESSSLTNGGKIGSIASSVFDCEWKGRRRTARNCWRNIAKYPTILNPTRRDRASNRPGTLERLDSRLWTAPSSAPASSNPHVRSHARL